jgi:undecaprenyl-diphosphatase
MPASPIGFAVHVAELAVAADLRGTVSYVLALFCSLRAFGTAPSLLRVAAAYLVAAAIGAASLTPGGLGAVEAALVGALIRCIVPAGPAIAGGLVFRLVT